ncbi:glycoside hydrolase family 30 beta sandwich domain-containing protein [Maribacter sp. TH_r10]|uniref:glycoside hydrolase family 30 protein n=1 Tax=Maribacter sp. TH_r10 TaxID=3082086 RepID=UPI0029536D24|nr:glycoside hydrolase family 30 beta sandwich domain-containing protein [Maribacter sp. TH_r10]MDV7137676.1 glycoside hydrolase family 30 beta sandwich domain-containing protein [Maribacter sp. TH_r10]
MNHPFILLLCALLLVKCSSTDTSSDASEVTPPDQSTAYSDVDLYVTKPDQSELFNLQANKVPSYTENGNFSITVDPETTYQTIDGFGFSLTGGSALHLNDMSDASRAEILNELFDSDNIGVSYLRISIGASDLDAEVFSYDDLSEGETDESLERFSIEKDKENLIPVLKEILAINPNIKIMGSPWSAPTWMKTNNNSIGGSLKPEYYAVYADYFVKYIKAYEAEGITVDAITVQNEPLHDGNNPSMYMEAIDQADFVKNHLGPAFETAGIQTKIIVWDHNADNPSYPITIFADAEANEYVDGSAFHLYGGSIDNLSTVHNAYPDKNLYFTEQWVGVNSEFDDNLLWHTRELIVGATRNWCKTVLEWNLASNSNLEIHTDGGCTECLGALTIDGDTVKRNVAYYIIAHASKFVRPGSVRVSSNYSSDLPNVAFETPSGDIVVIVVNNTSIDMAFNIKSPSGSISTSLDAGAVGTYVW